MKKPTDLDSILGCTAYLTRPRIVMTLRDGTDIYAPKGMLSQIIAIRNGKPCCVFPYLKAETENGRGFQVEWNQLTLKRPICKSCGQDTDPKDFTYKRHSK